MRVSRDRASLIKFYKRQYYNHLGALKMTIESELSGIQDEDFVPSTAVQTTEIARGYGFNRSVVEITRRGIAENAKGQSPEVFSIPIPLSGII